MKIQVETTAKETKTGKNGGVYTGVKIQGGGWVNIYGDHRGKRGQTLQISEPKEFAGAKWASIEKVASGNDDQPEWERPPGEQNDPGSRPPPAPAPTPARAPLEKTLTAYFATQSVVHAQAKKLEPDPADAQARVALVNNAMILWAEGKIVS